MSLQQMFLGFGSVLDAYFNRVSMLIHGNSTNGSNNNVFLDSGANNYTITSSGTAVQRPTQGSFTPFSPDWSVSFETAGHFTLPSNAAFQMSTGDFTIEAWYYFNTTTPPTGTNMVLYDMRAGVTAAVAPYLRVVSGVLYYTVASVDVITGPTIQAGQWYHIAISRSGTSTKMFVDGTQVGSTYTDTNDYVINGPFIGRLSGTAGGYFNGFMSNLRMVKGTAVYTSNFSPPSSDLTAISGTSLLTCQSRNFVDNSSNAFAVTPSTVAISPFNPFAQSTTYDTTINGGAAYFNGSTDYLTLPNNMTVIGSNQYTMECWVYPTIVSSGEIPIVKLYNATQTIDFRIVSSKMQSRINNSATIVGGNTTLYPNQWYHIAVVKGAAGLTKLYINGVAEATTATDSTTYTAFTIPRIGANQTPNLYFNGWICDVRVLNGTALYTANFTPPTAPLTNVTNTLFLTNFTNAGVYDNSRQTTLQTVGNVQISTAQSKFGGSSILFNNTTNSYINTSSIPVNANGQFTVEAWIYTANSHAQCIYSQFLTSNANRFAFNIDNYSGYKLALVHGTAPIVVANTVVPLNQWNHVALTRDANNTVRIFLNGTVDNTAVNYTSSLYQGNTRIGGVANTQPTLFNGYMDDIRITKGIARYTSNFDLPSAAFPDR
jgi:hypothetical protein